MRIDIITVLPEMLEGFVHESILARAEKKGLAEIRLHNLRDYTLDKWRRVDDYPYGGSAGMVMQCEPIDRCITALKQERDYDEVIFTSPDGERFDQHMANELSLKGNLIILAGHYKGRRAGGSHDSRRHRARGAWRHWRRAVSPQRLFPGRPAGGAHLHPSR